MPFTKIGIFPNLSVSVELAKQTIRGTGTEAQILYDPIKLSNELRFDAPSENVTMIGFRISIEKTHLFPRKL